MAGRVRRQRGHGTEAGTERRHVRSGSPQRSHSGGVSGRIDCQQRGQTGPHVGCSSGPSHDAHAGDTATLRIASHSADKRHVLARSPGRPKSFSSRARTDGTVARRSGCWRWGRDAPSVLRDRSPLVGLMHDHSRSMAADSRLTTTECRRRTAGCRRAAGDWESVSKARPAPRSPRVARGRRTRAARARRCAR